jgi:hypothetical protein
LSDLITINHQEMNNKKWNVAAVNGLMLSLITILYTLINSAFSPGKAVLIVLWIIKLAATLWLLLYFVKEYNKDQEVFTYKQGFNFAFIVSFLSAVFVAGYFFLHYALIFPGDVDKIADTINQAMAAQSSGDTSIADKIIAYFPHIMFISNLIYLTIFGLIASAIIANYTKKGDVFTQDKL